MYIQQIAKYEATSITGVYKYTYFEKGFFIVLYKVTAAVFPANSYPVLALSSDYRWSYGNFKYLGTDLHFECKLPIEQAGISASGINFSIRWFNYVTNTFSVQSLDTFNLPISIKIKYNYTGSGWTDYPDTSKPDKLGVKLTNEDGSLFTSNFISDSPYYSVVTFQSFTNMELYTQLNDARSYGRRLYLKDYFNKNAEWNINFDSYVGFSDYITFQITVSPSEALFYGDFISTDKMSILLKESYSINDIKYTTTDYPEIMLRLNYSDDDYPNTAVSGKKIISLSEVTPSDIFIKLLDDNGTNEYFYNGVSKDLFNTYDESLSNPIQFVYDSSRQAHKIKSLYSLNALDFIEPPVLVVGDIYSTTHEIRRASRCTSAIKEGDFTILLEFEPSRYQVDFSYTLNLNDIQLGFNGEFYQDGDIGGISWSE